MSRKPKGAPKCCSDSKPSPLRAAIAEALQNDADAPLISAENALSQTITASIVLALFPSRIYQGTQGARELQSPFEMPGGSLPPLL